MAQIFLRAYDGLIFSVGQLLAFEFQGQNMKATVKGVHCHSLGGGGGSVGGGRMGVLNGQTECNFMKDPTSAIKIKSSAKKYVTFPCRLHSILGLTSEYRAPPNAILAPNFKFEDMGIGGLDTEFSAIFRRAFASRIFPPGLVEKLGIQHVKGTHPILDYLR